MRDPAQDPELDPRILGDEEWRQLLTAAEYQILRCAGTERAFTGPHLEEEREGYFHCAGCGAKLYAAEHKFHSGCGWPSFFSEVQPGALTTNRDTSHGMLRLEMRCAKCDGHLGHIFDDAPNQPTGKRHCVNGHALVFVPKGVDLASVFAKHRSSKLS